MRRLSDRISLLPSFTRSIPSNSTEPAVGSMSRRIIRPVVDLPQPDSPTRPSVSPGMTSNETPLTARTETSGFLASLETSDWLIASRPIRRVAHAGAHDGRVPRLNDTATHVRPRSGTAADARQRTPPTHMDSDHEIDSPSARPSVEVQFPESSRDARDD